jgi:hypothetical protein
VVTETVELLAKNRDLALWRKTVEICQRCLELDRDMLARLGPPSIAPKDVEDYLDPKVWEQFIEAREDLVEFTTSSIHVLTAEARRKVNPGNKKEKEEVKEAFAEQTELEARIMKSLKEMVDLEDRLASYLTENLSVLRETIDGLTKNQMLFTNYSRRCPKPEPGFLSSEA